MGDQLKYQLDETRIPKVWYNIQADLPTPAPAVLHPGTLQPVGPDDLAPLFPMALIMQEVTTEREVEIPEPVREIYRMWRPTPLIRARGLEKALGTPAKIFYKYEGVSPAGSHKPNTAIPQAFYNKQEGINRLSTETGAGQWGSSLALAGSLFGIEVLVYQVRVSFDQKPYRRALMETYGATCVASPSNETNSGRAILARDPNHPGSLGIAISEAVEVAATHDDTITLEVDLTGGRALPAIGLSAAGHGEPLSATELTLLRALRPAHLHLVLDIGRHLHVERDGQAARFAGDVHGAQRHRGRTDGRHEDCRVGALDRFVEHEAELFLRDRLGARQSG